MSASQEEWTSLAVVLSRHYVNLDGHDLVGMVHCRRALALLERAAK